MRDARGVRPLSDMLREPEPLGAARVLPGFFELLRVEPLLGRGFRTGDG